MKSITEMSIVSEQQEAKLNAAATIDGAAVWNDIQDEELESRISKENGNGLSGGGFAYC